MEKSQWKALYDFSEEVGLTPSQLVSQLKELGVVDRNTTPKTLDQYCNDTSYQTMMNFLRENY